MMLPKGIEYLALFIVNLFLQLEGVEIAIHFGQMSFLGLVYVG